MGFMERDLAELHLRIPADLHSWITQRAEAENRSANGQANAMLALARSVLIRDDQAAAS